MHELLVEMSYENHRLCYEQKAVGCQVPSMKISHLPELRGRSKELKWIVSLRYIKIDRVFCR
jgi:hypothetical protein